MEIPKDVKSYEFSSSVVWMKNGIVYSTPKYEIQQQPNSENIKQSLGQFRAIFGNEKFCMVAEINPNSQPAKKEERDIVAAEIANVVKAMALITSSPITKMLANLFFGFKPPAYPVKMFSNEAAATNWIKQYL